jgi:hypothetical protein
VKRDYEIEQSLLSIQTVTDIESRQQHNRNTTSMNSMSSLAVTRCAALKVIVSICLIVEGISRINLFIGTPKGEWGGSHSAFPPAVELAASCGLTFYGAIRAIASCD